VEAAAHACSEKSQPLQRLAVWETCLPATNDDVAVKAVVEIYAAKSEMATVSNFPLVLLPMPNSGGIV